MKDRKYEIAMMRASGATSKLVLISILTEGFLIAFIGGLIGFFTGHILLEIMKLEMEINHGTKMI